MQIVININEEEYNEFNKSYLSYTDYTEYGRKLLSCFREGHTILPKGHGRLIDENDLWFEDIDDISCVTQRNVENAPTIIEADKGDGK